MTNAEHDQDEPVAYRACNVDEAGQGRPLPDDPRLHQALDQVARAAVRLHKAEREREVAEAIAAWLAGRQATIAAVLEALPAGMAPATQAANVHAALLAEVGQPAEVRVSDDDRVQRATMAIAGLWGQAGATPVQMARAALLAGDTQPTAETDTGPDLAEVGSWAQDYIADDGEVPGSVSDLDDVLWEEWGRATHAGTDRERYKALGALAGWVVGAMRELRLRAGGSWS